MIYTGNNNKAKKIKDIYIGDNNNTARKVKKIYIGDSNNKARLIYNYDDRNYNEITWNGNYVYEKIETNYKKETIDEYYTSNFKLCEGDKIHLYIEVKATIIENTSDSAGFNINLCAYDSSSEIVMKYFSSNDLNALDYNSKYDTGKYDSEGNKYAEYTFEYKDWDYIVKKEYKDKKLKINVFVEGYGNSGNKHQVIIKEIKINNKSTFK